MAPDIQAGTYRARGVLGSLAYTSTGTEQVAVEFVLLDDEGVEGPHITWFGFFTEKTMESTLRALRTCGWTGTDLSDLEGIDRNEVSLVIEHEDYNGRTQVKVRWVNEAGARGVALKAPLDADRARAFAAKMRAAVLAFDQSQGVRTPVAPRPAAPRSASRTGAILSPEPPPVTDDMPF